ncbi:hypothetical protein, partial [Lactobacillus nasalidis]|uniref:hypothetical protein n=1 Tax=Lactobacillus nasalidis TaxID=2797258 RepID=UPI001BA6781A
MNRGESDDVGHQRQTGLALLTCNAVSWSNSFFKKSFSKLLEKARKKSPPRKYFLEDDDWSWSHFSFISCLTAADLTLPLTSRRKKFREHP